MVVSDVALSPLGVALACAAVVALYLSSLFVLAYRRAKLSGASGVPEVPTVFPLGAAWLLQKYPRHLAFGKAQELYGDKEHGLTYVQLLTIKVLNVTHHEWLKELLNVSWHHTADGNLEKIHDMQVMKYWLGSESLVFNDRDREQRWTELRKLFKRSYGTLATTKLVPHMTAVHRTFNAYLEREHSRRCANSSQDSFEINWQKAVYPLTFDVFGRTSFSEDFQSIAAFERGETTELLRTFRELVAENGKRSMEKLPLAPWLHMRCIDLPTSSNIQFRRNTAYFESVTNDLIEKRREALRKDPSLEFDDFLQTFMDAKDDDTGLTLTEQQLRHNIKFILAAGVDTSATTLMFTMYTIASHPQVQSKLQAEVDRALPGDTHATHDTYNELRYTRNVIKETLRLYPAATATIRATEKDVTMDGITIPQGTEFLMELNSIMRSPHNFERPNEFIPERYDEPDFNGRAWLPFLGGRRNCPGQRFAEVSLALCIAMLVKSWEFSVPRDYTFEYVAPSGAGMPKDDLRLILRPREQEGHS